MLSSLIAQWETANLAAFELLGKVVTQSANPAGLPGAVTDVGAWRTFARTALQAGQHYSTVCQSALDESWREQRDRLALKDTAAAVKQLATLNTDLATRIAQGHMQHAGALADATAQYLDDLSHTRGISDLAMAFGKFSGDVQAQSRAHALHVAALAGGIVPALSQWADTNLTDDTERAS
jgi:ubiquinone biosynthesis protein UbiJ